MPRYEGCGVRKMPEISNTWEGKMKAGMERVVMGEGSGTGVNDKASWSGHALFAASEEYPGFGFPTPHPVPNL